MCSSWDNFIKDDLVSWVWYGKALSGRFYLEKPKIENPDDVAGDDFHTGHHRHHVKNFGHNCLLDMLFSTCESNNSYRMMISKSVYQVVKKEEEKTILFCFTKLSSTQTSEAFLKTLPAKNISKSTFRTKEDSMSGCWQNNIVLGRNIRKKPDHEI